MVSPPEPLRGTPRPRACSIFNLSTRTYTPAPSWKPYLTYTYCLYLSCKTKYLRRKCVASLEGSVAGRQLRWFLLHKNPPTQQKRQFRIEKAIILAGFLFGFLCWFKEKTLFLFKKEQEPKQEPGQKLWPCYDFCTFRRFLYSERAAASGTRPPRPTLGIPKYKAFTFNCHKSLKGVQFDDFGVVQQIRAARRAAAHIANVGVLLNVLLVERTLRSF